MTTRGSEICALGGGSRASKHQEKANQALSQTGVKTMSNEVGTAYPSSLGETIDLGPEEKISA